MCQGLTGPTIDGNDEWFLDNETHRSFIKQVQAIRETAASPEAALRAIEPLFADLLANPDWLPDYFMNPAADSGMGSGIGMWLLYRSGDGNLAFSSLVVPPGAATPVHDHLAWGIVGLYKGTQAETVFARSDDGSVIGKAALNVQDQKGLVPGDMYDLLPETDIHQVTTTSDVTSVSLHLLGNDNGCITRHRFHPSEGRVEPFRSGWLNVACVDQATSAD
ncbi:MAG TPA: cysteine dioxygenase family protein [Thermomicrobiales bacterium]|nr:cysteine dioxygenase family protein [Thermomicrobiales bacterium]